MTNVLQLVDEALAFEYLDSPAMPDGRKEDEIPALSAANSFLQLYICGSKIIIENSHLIASRAFLLFCYTVR